jgi:protocatechuate 3,4-dioxygenase beta subunit
MAAAVAGWLHGTAWRVATKARAAAAARRRREQSAPPRPTDDPAADVALRELQALLHAEVAALPAKYRTPFVLCVLEGRGRAEVAAALGWNEGTLSTRLAWARRRLRSRLLRRGVDVAAALTAVELARDAMAAVPVALAQSAVTAARTGVVSAAVAALAKGGLMTTKLAPLAALGLVSAALAAGTAGLLGSDPPVPDTPKGKAPTRAAAPPPAPAQKAITCPVTVTGTATGPDGKPVSGATVALCWTETDQGFDAKLVATATTGERGRYEFRDAAVPVPKGGDVHVQVSAMATGLTYAWSPLVKIHARPAASAGGTEAAPRLVTDPLTLDLTFRPASPLRGRVVDEAGRAVPGVAVSLSSLDDLRNPGELSVLFSSMEAAVPMARRSTSTDRAGRFRLDGAPRTCLAHLEIRHSDYPKAFLLAGTEGMPSQFTGDFDVTLFKPRTIPVRVTDRRTGRPVAGGQAELSHTGRVQYWSESVTDADGRAVLRMPPGDCQLTVRGPRGGVYVEHTESLTVNVTAEQPREVRLVPGCRLRVEAVDARTGRPLAGAEVRAVNDFGGWIGMETGHYYGPAKTDELGLLGLTVRPGQRQIVADLDGYEAVKGPTGPVDLPAGGEVRLRFELRKKE